LTAFATVYTCGGKFLKVQSLGKSFRGSAFIFGDTLISYLIMLIRPIFDTVLLGGDDLFDGLFATLLR